MQRCSAHDSISVRIPFSFITAGSSWHTGHGGGCGDGGSGRCGGGYGAVNKIKFLPRGGLDLKSEKETVNKISKLLSN